MDTPLSPLAQLAVDPDRLGEYLRDSADEPEAVVAGGAPGVREPEPERPGVREPDGVREPA